jgi:hypothetical protein
MTNESARRNVGQRDTLKGNGSMANSFRGFGGNRTFRHEAPSGFNNLRSGQPGDAPGDNAVAGPMPALIGANIGDVTDSLPPPAVKRLQGMRERAADLGVLSRNSFEIEQELRTEKAQTENRIRVLKQPRGDGGHGLGDDDPRVRAEQKNVDLKTAELARRRELSEVRGHEQQVLLRLIGNCETWLRGGGRPGGTVCVAFDGEFPKLKDGADLPAAIEDRRRRLRELAADRHRVESAPFLSATAKAKIRGEIEALAELGAPSVGGLIEHNANLIEWPVTQISAKIYNSDPAAVGYVEVFDSRAFLCWLHKDAVLARLDAECDASSDDAAALTDAQREKAIAQISADCMAVERAEAALVWLAQERGMGISHREDCSPLALLGLQLIATPNVPSSDDRSHLTEFVGVPR